MIDKREKINNEGYGKISVIVPIYNAKEYIRKSIYNIIKQTYTNLEILLIDDGSTDGSENICEELAKEDKRIVVFHKLNGGVSSARNLGIKKSTGNYITFVDADDTIDENMYDILLKNLIYSNADISICDFLCVKGKRIKPNNNFNSIEILNKNDSFKKLMGEIYYQGFSCNKMYKASIIKEKNILFNEELTMCEDLLFNEEYMEFINLTVYDHKKLYNYIMRKDSACHSFKLDEKLFSVIKAYRYIEEKYINNCNDIIPLYFNYLVAYANLKEKLLRNSYKGIELKDINNKSKKYLRILIKSRYMTVQNVIKYILRVYFTKTFIFVKDILIKL